MELTATPKDIKAVQGLARVRPAKPGTLRQCAWLKSPGRELDQRRNDQDADQSWIRGKETDWRATLNAAVTTLQDLLA